MFDAFHLVERLDQAEECFTGLFAEIAYIHPREYNRFSSGFGHVAGLGGELFDGPASASAPGKRYGAVGAIVIAAILYFQEVAGAIASRTGGRVINF